MAKIFVCYARQNREAVEAVVGDVEDLGHGVWFDGELDGGQTWWDTILAQIRECDLLLVALSPELLDSTACKREYTYAAALGKPIMPVAVSEGISMNLLPPALSAIHIVDYLTRNTSSAVHLSRAITNTPPAPPLPEPLPGPPDLPVSYLGGLRERIVTSGTLGYAEQSALLLDVKRSLRAAETAGDGRVLLGELRRRPDLLANIAEEIDQTLQSPDEPPPLRREPLRQPLPDESDSVPIGSPTIKDRAQAFVGGDATTIAAALRFTPRRALALISAVGVFLLGLAVYMRWHSPHGLAGITVERPLEFRLDPEKVRTEPSLKLVSEVIEPRPDRDVELFADPHDEAFQSQIANPFPATFESKQRGQHLYATYCALCHGDDGQGDGSVSNRGSTRGPFVAVLPLAGPSAITGLRPDGHIYATIVVGRRRMPGLPFIAEEDRWHIVNWLREMDLKARSTAR